MNIKERVEVMPGSSYYVQYSRLTEYTFLKIIEWFVF